MKRNGGEWGEHEREHEHEKEGRRGPSDGARAMRGAARDGLSVPAWAKTNKPAERAGL